MSMDDGGAPPQVGPSVDDFRQALVMATPRVWVTRTIVLANIAVFGVMLATGVHIFKPEVADMLNWGANFGPKTLESQWWRLVTCMFLHSGVLHLGMNMWVLSDLGRLVERLVGNLGFLLIYFVSGIAGSLTSLAWHPTVVCVGASGAVFGVAGALLALVLLRSQVVPVVVLKPMRQSMGAFVIFNVAFGLSASGIDMAAHLGGLVAGFVCGTVLCQPLTPDSVARRLWRNVAVLAVSAPVLFLVARSLPDPLPDPQVEMRRFVELERRTLEHYQQLIAQASQGQLTEAELADRIDREILPDWTAGRKDVEDLLGQSYTNHATVGRLVQYMQHREAGWRLQMEAIREQNSAKLEQSQESMAAANELAKQLTSP